DITVQSEKGLGAGALALQAHAKVDKGRLVGNAKIAAAGFGEIEIADAHLDVPNRLDARSLQRTTGTMELRGSIDLSQGAALFAGESVERVSGMASFEARIERGDPEALPAVRATVRTHDLEAVLANNEPSAGPSSSTVISGVDLLTHVAWDGRTEDAEIGVVSWD